MLLPHHSDEGYTPSIFTQSWGLTWRKALVSLPRLVPDAALHFISPDGPQPVHVRISSRSKHHIPLYVFIPPQVTTRQHREKSKNQATSLPVVLDFHGGGFVMGSCQEQAQFCSKLCRDLNCLAISVDYRMGPYSHFPAAFEDAEDVLNAIINPTKPGYNELRKSINSSLPPSHPKIILNASRLAISGFSSGGSLALNLALSVPPTLPHLQSAWPSSLPPSHKTPIPLLLFYPALDTRKLPHERDPPPGLAPSTGLLASLHLEQELMPTYLPASLASHPRASPALVQLDQTFPTTTFGRHTNPLHPSAKPLLILPEIDSLTASNKLWAERVRQEGRGADLEVVDIPGMGHGWTQYPDHWLEPHARAEKAAIFNRTVEYVRRIWEGK